MRGPFPAVTTNLLFGLPANPEKVASRTDGPVPATVLMIRHLGEHSTRRGTIASLVDGHRSSLGSIFAPPKARFYVQP